MRKLCLFLAPLLLGAALNADEVFAKDSCPLPLRLYHHGEKMDCKEKNPLIEAALSGNSKEVAKLLASGMDIESIGTCYKHTPLCAAVESGDFDTVKILTEKGARLNVINNHGRTPFFAAVEDSKNEIAKLLFNAGADINVISPSGRTPLISAAYNANAEMVKLLLDNGFKYIDRPDNESYTALMSASSWPGCREPAVAEMLIKAGADINKKNKYGSSALIEALRYGKSSAKVAEILLEAGAEVKGIVDMDGSTPLMLASNKKLAETIIKRGADVNEKIYQGFTPLMKAKNGEVAEVFIKAGAKLEEKDDRGQTALMNTELLDVAEVLIKAGADVNTRNINGETPLMKAKTKEFAELLIAKGADVNAKGAAAEYWSLPKEKQNLNKDELYETPLHYAISQGNKEVVQTLLAHGADIKALNQLGRTVLEEAVNPYRTIKVDREIVEILINAGADVNSAFFRVKDAATAELLIKHGADLSNAARLLAATNNLEVAELLFKHGVKIDSDLIITTDKPEVSEFLIKHGANVNAKDKYGETALFKAVKRRNKSVAALLIKAGADVNARADFYIEDTLYSSGNTALLEAVGQGADGYAVAEMLIKAGADVNAQNSQGYTPLMNCRDLKTAEMLIKAGADINIVNDEGNSAIMFSYKKEIAELLFENGADLKKGVISTHNREAAEYLISVGADINAKDKNGNTALINSVSELLGNEGLFEVLLKHGADINARGAGGTTALIEAPQCRGSLALALIKAGADVNAKDDKGRTPIAEAVAALPVYKGGNPFDFYEVEVEEVVKALIKAGAKCGVKTQDGKTLAEVAYEKGYKELTAFLKKCGSK